MKNGSLVCVCSAAAPTTGQPRSARPAGHLPTGSHLSSMLSIVRTPANLLGTPCSYRPPDEVDRSVVHSAPLSLFFLRLSFLIFDPRHHCCPRQDVLSFTIFPTTCSCPSWCRLVVLATSARVGLGLSTRHWVIRGRVIVISCFIQCIFHLTRDGFITNTLPCILSCRTQGAATPTNSDSLPG